MAQRRRWACSIAEHLAACRKSAGKLTGQPRLGGGQGQLRPQTRHGRGFLRKPAHYDGGEGKGTQKLEKNHVPVWRKMMFPRHASQELGKAGRRALCRRRGNAR